MTRATRERLDVARRSNLVLSGGVGHDFAGTSAILKESLAALGVDSVIVEIMEDACASLESAELDLLTINCLRWRMPQARFAAQRAAEAWETSPRFRAAVTAHLARGGGLLALHAAVLCFDDWPEWGRILGGRWSWPRSWHPDLGPVLARVCGSHPIVRGLRDFELQDEVYCDLDLCDDVEPLIDSEVRGRRQPLLWARPYGGGRVVCNLLGHGVASSAAAAHRRIHQRGAAWAMGADEPADIAGPPRRGARSRAAPITALGRRSER